MINCASDLARTIGGTGFWKAIAIFALLRSVGFGQPSPILTQHNNNYRSKVLENEDSRATVRGISTLRPFLWHSRRQFASGPEFAANTRPFSLRAPNKTSF
jgi:hypothetical protein